ncbi:MAG: hypothetical protein JST85_14455 [Acidobacteria bacterium]|nr:hypothetical protein [Acidobacteriota bacterium]
MRLNKNLNPSQLLQHQRHRIKALCFVLALFFFASFAKAQVPSDRSAKSDVIVLQKKWREEYRNAALDEDQFAIQKEREQEDRTRRGVETQNEIKNQQGMPTKAPPDPKLANRPRGISVAYIYEVKFKNAGAKEIRALTWEYVFSDPATNREVGRRRFVSKVSIGSGKTKTVVENSSSPPTGSIDAAKAGKKSQEQYLEQVMIQSIAYADGSEWKAASN